MSFIDRCESWLSERTGGRAFLTPSCTAALELSCLLLDLKAGDEVILPSFGFSSCANAVILRGATPVFVDIETDTLRMDWDEAWRATTPKTRAHMPIHYAGVQESPRVAVQGVSVIEDAAQCIGGYEVRGDFGCISFHSTKNVQCGEGGAIVIRDEEAIEKAQVLRSSGTTKQVVKHAWDWVGVGSSYLMSEVLAEYLWIQLQRTDEITERRREVWHIYRDGLKGVIKAQHPGNGHIFWFLVKDRAGYIARCAARGVELRTHYTPLHSRAPGLKYGRTHGTCWRSTQVSESIVRPDMTVSASKAREIVSILNQEMERKAA